MQEVISRDDAISMGMKYYFTGIPCSRGHVSKRIVSSWGCHQCRLDMTRRKRIEIGCIPWSRNEEEKKERRRLSLKRYRERNAEKVKLSQEKFKIKNPDRYKAIKKKWSANNKESLAIKSQNRRARNSKNGGQLSKDIKSRLFKLQKGRCACCGLPLGNDFHLDHIVPIALGGRNDDSNTQLLRAICNIKKGFKDPVAYMQSLGFLL